MKPFLRWLGGKRKLAPGVLAHVPDWMRTYHEPMLGSGAVFLRLLQEGRIRQGAVLSDCNLYLIRAWKGIIADPVAVQDALRQHAWKHSYAYFLEQRLRQQEMLTASDVVAAAWFVYINRSSFNGLWRIASDGSLNASWGNRTKTSVEDKGLFIQLAAAMTDAGLSQSSFGVCDVIAKLDRVQEGDVAYVDPPYVATFDDYTQSGFTPERHGILAAACSRVAQRGARVIVSQSAEAAPLYDPHLLPLQGCLKTNLAAYRSVSAKACTRGAVNELLYVAGGQDA